MLADSPYAVSPLAATAQAINVSHPGSEPDILEDVKEDLSAWSVVPSGMTVKVRKKYFSNLKATSRLFFDPNLVYTFDFYQHMFNPLEMELIIPLGLAQKTIDLKPYLNYQPMVLMARLRQPQIEAKRENYYDPSKAFTERSELYFWNFEVWHEALLPKEIINRSAAHSESNTSDLIKPKESHGTDLSAKDGKEGSFLTSFVVALLPFLGAEPPPLLFIVILGLWQSLLIVLLVIVLLV